MSVDLSHMTDEDLANRLCNEFVGRMDRELLGHEAARRLRARDSARAPSTQAFRVDFEARALLAGDGRATEPETGGRT